MEPRKWYRWTGLQGRNWDTDAENKRMDTKGGKRRRGGGGGGRNWGIGIDMYTLMCIKWMTTKNLLHKKINKIKFKKIPYHNHRTLILTTLLHVLYRIFLPSQLLEKTTTTHYYLWRTQNFNCFVIKTISSQYQYKSLSFLLSMLLEELLSNVKLSRSKGVVYINWFLYEGWN